MGLMTFADFTTELGFLLGNRTDTDSTNPARLSRWINQAYIYMAHPSVHKFRETQAIATITLISGSNEYDISSITSGATVAIRWLVYVDGTSSDPSAPRQRLKPRTIRWMEQRSIPTGRPIFYAIDGFSVFIYAVPGTAEDSNKLRVGLYREPAVLTGNNATILNSYFDRPLIKFAHAFAEGDLGDRAKSLIILKEASSLLNNAAEETEMEAEDDGNRIEFTISSPMGPM